MIMDIEKVVGITGDDLKQICDAYHEIKSNEEIQTLHAKVASADVLVEALREITYSHDGYARKKAEQALSTYDKLSEVKREST